MAGTFDPLLAGLARYHQQSLDSGARGLDAVCGEATDAMRQTQAHGDETGATRHAYSARRIGRGESGAAAHATSVAAVQEFNPEHLATAPVTVGGAFGAILDSPTDYQVFLERNNAGQRAVLGPTLARFARRFTRGVANGMRRKA